MERGYFLFPRGQDRLKIGLHINPGGQGVPRGVAPAVEGAAGPIGAGEETAAPFSRKEGLTAAGRQRGVAPHTPRAGARRGALRGAHVRRGGAERRATLSALWEARTGAASLAPTPAGSMTPHWLAGRGGVGRGGGKPIHVVNLAVSHVRNSREKQEIPRLRTAVAPGGCGRFAGDCEARNCSCGGR